MWHARPEGRLAQLGERLPYKQEVGGSIPSPPTRDLPLSEPGVSADNQAVEAAEQAWRPLGELLLAKGLISQEELDRGLTEQEETGRLLGAILVERGYVSGPALAIALAEQYGVELDQQQGFGTGLWAEIERRHRSGRGVEDPEPLELPANLVRLEPVVPPLEAVPDPKPDLKLELLEAENRMLQDEIERLHAEFTKLRVIEAETPEPEPEPEQPSSHLLFIPTPARYLLVERQGPPPQSGDQIALSEGSFVVGKLGRAPVPGERRACAFLLAAS